MKLIFVYKAKSGRLHAVLDIAHKIISPSTYQCDLCALTHDALAEKQSWKEYRQNTAHELVFFHEDEFEAKYAERFEYPVILRESEASLAVALSADEIAQCESVDQLIARLKALGKNLSLS